MTTSQPCEVHTSHAPTPRVNHKHHVWPLGKGGPDIPENIIVVCPTGHANIHDLLREYEVNLGRVTYTTSRRYARGEARIAKLGWDRIRTGKM